jgi:hypothetical protein
LGLDNLTELLELRVRAQEVEVAHITSGLLSSSSSTSAWTSTATSPSLLCCKIEQVYVIVIIATLSLRDGRRSWGIACLLNIVGDSLHKSLVSQVLCCVSSG